METQWLEEAGGNGKPEWALGSMGRRARALRSHGIYSRLPVLLNDHNVSALSYLQDVTRSQDLFLLCDGGSGIFYMQEDVLFSPSLKMGGRSRDFVRHELLRTSQAQPEPSLPTEHPRHHLLSSSTSLGPSHVTAAPRAHVTPSASTASPQGQELSHFSFSPPWKPPQACQTRLWNEIKSLCSKASQRQLYICINDAPRPKCA